MTTLLFQLTIMLGWGACTAGVAYYCLHIARQITYVTLADGRRQERALPLAFRLLLPFAGNLRPLARHPALRQSRTLTDRQLVMSGFDGLLSGDEFLAIRFLNPLLFGAV